MLVHDYDDEQTLEEEENYSSESGDNEEIDDLQKVSFELNAYQLLVLEYFASTAS